jgi:hypothetical protein
MEQGNALLGVAFSLRLLSESGFSGLQDEQE